MQTSTEARKPAVRRRLALVVGAAMLLGGVLTASTTAAPSYGDWSAPVNLGPVINTSASEGGATLSADGLSLFFNSSVAGGFGMADLFVSHRASPDAAWGAPVNLGSVLNTAAQENYSTLSDDGHWLFFGSNRSGGVGGFDLYQSYRADVDDDLGWQAPASLGANVNSTADETAPDWFDNGGHPQLLFTSNRPGVGSNDLYVSDRQPDGSWGPARLIPDLSTPDFEQRPSIRSDGLEIFFHSDRPGTPGIGGDLWTATRASTSEPWSTPVNVAALNTNVNDILAHLSPDGRTLHWSSQRPGGSGGFDLWMATRAAKLTVTADDQSRLFGQANPPLTYELTGFVGGETASVVSGSAACSTTATASSPAGDYAITCTVGSLSAPGYVFETFVAGTLTVSYSQPCLTGTSAGPLHVAAGEAVCIGAGAAHTGPVTIAPGGSLDVEGGRITGPLTANGAAAVRICGATITGPLTITGSTGPVVVGGEGCEPNMVVGPVRVTDNDGGVEVSGNTVVGPLRVAGNAAPTHAAGNTVTGPVAIQT
jgi:hypothetical protein